jgi:hypothetical protein
VLLLKAASTNKVLLTAVLFLGDGLFFILSDPHRLSPIFLTLGFVLLGATIYVICRFAAWLLKSIGLLNHTRRWVLATVSLAIFLLMVLKAMGQLSGFDVLAVILLSLVAYFYYTRVGKIKTTV